MGRLDRYRYTRPSVISANYQVSGATLPPVSRNEVRALKYLEHLATCQSVSGEFRFVVFIKQELEDFICHLMVSVSLAYTVHYVIQMDTGALAW